MVMELQPLLILTDRGHWILEVFFCFYLPMYFIIPYFKSEPFCSLMILMLILYIFVFFQKILDCAWRSMIALFILVHRFKYSLCAQWNFVNQDSSFIFFFWFCFVSHLIIIWSYLDLVYCFRIVLFSSLIYLADQMFSFF